MVKKVKVTGGRVEAGALVLSAQDKNGLTTDFEISAEVGELLLATLTTGLGHLARARTGENIKTVLPTEWWEINRQENGAGLLFSWRIQGGMEMTFHLGEPAIARFEEVLRSLSGTLEYPVAGQRN